VAYQHRREPDRRSSIGGCAAPSSGRAASASIAARRRSCCRELRAGARPAAENASKQNARIGLISARAFSCGKREQQIFLHAQARKTGAALRYQRDAEIDDLTPELGLFFWTLVAFLLYSLY